jgi:hypothetical protein
MASREKERGAQREATEECEGTYLLHITVMPPGTKVVVVLAQHSHAIAVCNLQSESRDCGRHGAVCFCDPLARCVSGSVNYTSGASIGPGGPWMRFR